jgi:bifunctional non-homologous end joining protein LigD
MTEALASAGHATIIGFVPPQLATLVDSAPPGDDWLHEVKFDGYRIECRIVGPRVTLFTRTGQDWTERFQPVADAAAGLDASGALLDGEIAILRPDGTTSFQALQNHLGGEAQGQLVYFVFDALFLGGRDLRPLPLEDRKAALARLLRSEGWSGSGGGVIRFTEHVVGDGPAFFEKARAAGLEGIVSKRRGEPYHGGRGPGWVKTKALRRQELVIGGFTEPEGAREGIGALLVGFYRAGVLVPAGKVGTGFSQKVARELRKRLDALVTDRSPFTFTGPIPGGGRRIHWVKPEVVAEIAFGELTRDGKLRHPSFQGLRADKPAREVVQELPSARVGTSRPPRRSTSTRTARRPRAPPDSGR